MAETIEGLHTENGTAVRYTGAAEELVLTEDITRIAPFAFAGCKTLKKIVTPHTLRSIGKGAFFGCDSLVEATLPGKLYLRVKGGKVFPADADIYFRFYVTSGELSADEDYSDAFDTAEAYIASGIDDAEQASLCGNPDGCLIVTAAAPANAADDGVKPQGDEDKTEETVEEDIEIAVEECVPHEEIDLSDTDADTGTLQERMDAVFSDEEKDGGKPASRNLVNISDYLIDGERVVRYIGSAAETKVPQFIKVIGGDAFSNSNVVKVELPPEVDTIEKNAFAWCSELKEINLPEGLRLIDDGAFASCRSLEYIAFPESLKFIGADAFRACSGLKEIALPRGLSAISRRAFDFCVSLEEVELPDGVTVLADGVFSHCENLRKAVLPAGLKSIGAWAFAECRALREINFPDGLEEIGEVAFLNCASLVAFDLPATVARLGRQAFSGCASLHLVTLPRRLEKQLKSQKVFYRLPSVNFVFTDGDDFPPIGG